MCNSCIHNLNHCQFSDFLTDDEYYLKDEKGDCYCLFHAPKELKEKFTYAQNELFAKTIDEYIDTMIKQTKTVDFSDVVFHIPIIISNKNATLLDFYFETLDEYRVESNIKIDFTNALFYEYVDIRNIKCKELVFEDTKFLKGGALKNREGTNNLHIEHLVFRPFVVESDFVIDIGGYANEDGKIEVDVYGTIKNIEFENHKEGKGIVYFVGLNSGTEKADFRNRILDNVSFQNCDLSQCYFLNAKVDKTEFRNCTFPFIQQGITMSVIDKNGMADVLNPLFGLLMIIGLYVLGAGIVEIPFNVSFLVGVIQVLYVLLPLLIIYFMVTIVQAIYFIEAMISWSITENKYQYVNKIKTLHYHKGTGDEQDIKYQLGLTVSKNKSKQIQETIASLESLYRQLKINFNRYDYQLSGDFFFAQRLMEVYGSKYKDNLFERSILALHYGINGFGEKFIRPIVFFLATIMIFASLYVPNKDFVATDKAPTFLFDPIENKCSSIDIPNYKVQVIKKIGSECLQKRIFIAQTLKNRDGVTIVYSLSQFISPFTSKNRLWFKTVSSKGSILNVLETVLLYLFFGAFLLALKNRIKR